MSIVTKRLVDLSEDEFNRCRELTFRSRGLMEEEAVAARFREQMTPPYRHTLALMLYRGKTMIGWSLLQPVKGQARWLAYFYVDPLHRKRGYGSLLLKQASAFGRYKIAVKPDWSNHEFFGRFKDLWVEQREDAQV